MDKPQIPDDNPLKRKALYNKSDLNVWKKQTVDSSHTARKAQIRKALADETKAFLARGGKIQKIANDKTGYESPPKAFSDIK